MKTKFATAQRNASKRNSPVNFLYSLDRDRVRVWRDDWASDVFEVMAQNEFQQFRIFCNKFGFALSFQEED